MTDKLVEIGVERCSHGWRAYLKVDGKKVRVGPVNADPDVAFLYAGTMRDHAKKLGGNDAWCSHIEK